MNDITQLYDSLGECYLSNMYTNNSWTIYVDEKEKQTVREFWNLSKDRANSEEILDLGMGPGRWSLFFVNLGFGKVYGLDISSSMVAAAIKRISSRNFIAKVGDMEKLPYKSSMFDKVFCFRAFKYSHHPGEALQEISRVMKKDGTFLLEISNKSLFNEIVSFISTFILLLNPKIKPDSRWRYFLNANFYSDKQIRKLAKKCGLRVIKDEALFVLPSIPLPSLFGWTTSLLRLFDNLLFASLPKRWFARSWIFLMVKKEPLN